MRLGEEINADKEYEAQLLNEYNILDTIDQLNPDDPEIKKYKLTTNPTLLDMFIQKPLKLVN